MTIGPILILTQLAFLTVLVQRGERSGALSHQVAKRLLVVVWVGLGGWSALTAVLGATGSYQTNTFYAICGPLWIPTIPILVFLGPVLAVPTLRNGLEAAVMAAPRHWLSGIQVLRVAAIGTAYKTYLGLFPEYFEFAVGLPDLLFGISALLITWLVFRDRIGKRAIVTWHALGMLIIVPTAPLLLQMGVPGPLRVFTSAPTAELVYAFPMALAPTMAVPTFVLINGLAIWREVRMTARPPRVTCAARTA